jgi:hypothetical protein
MMILVVIGVLAYGALMAVLISRQRRRSSRGRDNIDLTDPQANRSQGEANRAHWEQSQRHSGALAAYRRALTAANAAVNNLRPPPWGMSRPDRLERQDAAARALVHLAEAATAYADDLGADQGGRSD